MDVWRGKVGLQFAKIKASPEVGNVELPEDHITRGSIVAAGRLDQIDNVNFPIKGIWHRSGFSLSEWPGIR